MILGGGLGRCRLEGREGREKREGGCWRTLCAGLLTGFRGLLIVVVGDFVGLKAVKQTLLTRPLTRRCVVNSVRE